MATRPVFTPCDKQYQLVQEINVEFKWHAGLAYSQKLKNVVALREAALQKGIQPILEVSTKSDDEAGVRLSAFNLKVVIDDGGLIPLESAFQGSKVFETGGPFTDLYGKSGYDVKKDERLRSSGPIRGFDFQGIRWSAEPKTAFYDWLYLHAVKRDADLHSHIVQFNGFTDVEFNPEKSVNCQARSCALYVSLHRRQMLQQSLESRDLFLQVLQRDSFYQPHSVEQRQGLLF